MSVIVFILTKKFKWITIHLMILPFSADIYISLCLESPYSTANQLDSRNLKDNYLCLHIGLCVQNVCWKGDIIYNSILVISILRIRYNREHIHQLFIHTCQVFIQIRRLLKKKPTRFTYRCNES